MLGAEEHVLVSVVADANEGVTGVGKETAEGAGDAGRVEELKDEAAVANAKLESGGRGIIGVPLDAETDDEAAAADVGEEAGTDFAEPCTDDGGGGSENDVDTVAVEEVYSECSEPLRI